MSRRTETPLTEGARPYPPIGEYALIGDCHSAALVSRESSVDWCCMPRFDSASIFGRLLDWDRGGYCMITPAAGDVRAARFYLDDTLVLGTTFDAPGGEATVYDCLTTRQGGARHPWRQLLRVVEGSGAAWSSRSGSARALTTAASDRGSAAMGPGS